uniref:DnaJ-like protein C11 C-terminal domain-containing protein n=1 Tax=Craspedostauros australis TaxID=1486917 RepID=A0A7R9ZSE1_9STRA
MQRELMVRQAERKMKQEIKSNGLIVQKATYAVPAGGNGGNPKSLDVTVQLQFWVNKSTLTLSASSKKDLLGFYDITAAEDDSVDEEARKVDAAAPPHRGDATADSLWWQLAWQSLWEDNDDTADPDDSMEQTKKPSSMPELLIDYTYKGKPMHVRVQDNEALQLP